MKEVDGKYDPTYMFRSAKIAVHHVREYGAKKYLNRDTWVKTDRAEYLKAAERHLDALKEGEEFAEDSGLPHIWHALCDIMFVIESEKIEMQDIDEEFDVAFSNSDCPRSIEASEKTMKRETIKRSLLWH